MIYKYLILATTLIVNVSLALSQVTIGNNEAPEKGALLQLKNIEGITDGSANATKGLGLPRILLTEKTSLVDIDPNNTERPDPNEHQGLIVYNLDGNLCKDLYTGINVWDGNQWQPIPYKEQEVFVDVMTDYRDLGSPQTYKIAKFGDAGWWMTENLRATTWPNATISPSKSLTKAPVSPSGISHTDAYFQYPNLDPTIIDTNPECGILYNWMATVAFQNTTINTNQSSLNIRNQGICPDGWHLPNMIEFRELLQEIRNNPCVYGTDPVSAHVGSNIKAPEKVPNSTFETGGTSRPLNKGGFNALLPGFIFAAGASNIEPFFYGQNTVFYSCCAAEDNPNADHAAYVIFTGAMATDIGENNPSRTAFASVRCKKD